MSEITREELLAFTEAHSKVSIALEKISDRLADIAANQEKQVSALGEINETVTDKIPVTVMEKLNSSEMAKDIDFVKVLVSVFGIVIVVVVVLVKIIFTPPPLTQSEVKQIVGDELYSMRNSPQAHVKEETGQ